MAARRAELNASLSEAISEAARARAVLDTYDQAIAGGDLADPLLPLTLGQARGHRDHVRPRVPLHGLRGDLVHQVVRDHHARLGHDPRALEFHRARRLGRDGGGCAGGCLGRCVGTGPGDRTARRRRSSMLATATRSATSSRSSSRSIGASVPGALRSTLNRVPGSASSTSSRRGSGSRSRSRSR